MLNTPSKSATRLRSRPSSYFKVEDDIPVAIHFDHVFKFRIAHHRDSSRQHCCKFQSQMYASLTQETEIIFIEISSQVERVQGISVGEIVTTYEQTLVFAELSGSGRLLYALIHCVS